MNETYFFDTYAIFELINGNDKYKKFKDVLGLTTIFNIAELNYALKRELSKSEADELTENFYKLLIDIELDDIKKAMDLRGKYKKMSPPDVIGYTVAQRLGIKFLTGDEDFKDFDNVELVKK